LSKYVRRAKHERERERERKRERELNGSSILKESNI